jgi:hypothetical protein
MPFITWASWPIQIIASISLKQSHSNTYLNSKAPRNQGSKIKDTALGSGLMLGIYSEWDVQI